ncbi:MAG: IctB family putative bicarbonate transporter [Pseudanabaenaceae cyanobacterium]
MVRTWWASSYLGGLCRLWQRWARASHVAAGNLLLGVLTFLFGGLPFLANEQIGLGCGVVSVLTLLAIARMGFPPLTVPVLAYGGTMTLATIFSPVRGAALDGWIKLGLYLGTFWGVALTFRAKPHSRFVVVWAYLLGALATEIYGLRQAVFGAAPLATWTDPESPLAEATRIYSFFGNPNLLAAYLLPALPLGIGAAAQSHHGGPKLLAGTIALLALVCVPLTLSRGALLGLATEILVGVMLLALWLGYRRALPLVAGSALGGLGLAIALVPTLRLRALSLLAGTGDTSSNFRVRVWQAVLRMIGDRPWLGFGPGNKVFKAVYPLYQAARYSALGTYSVPLEITAEGGVLSLLAFGGLLGQALIQGGQRFAVALQQRTGGWWVGVALCAVAGTMTHGLTDTMWYRPPVQLVWWLTIALLVTDEP